MEETRDEKTVPSTGVMKSLSFGRLSDMVAKHMPSSGFPGTGALFPFLRRWMVLFTVLIECVPSKEGRKGRREGGKKTYLDILLWHATVSLLYMGTVR
jgi:hypothetical protein